MNILAVLPIAFGVALFFIAYNYTREKSSYTNIRVALLYTILVVSLYVVLTTELLSLFHQLNIRGMLIVWLVPTVGIGMYALDLSRLIKSPSEEVRALASLKREWIIYVILFFILISFILSVSYPTNNYDSLCYHMGRVAHWVQNQSIGNYPSHVIRQLIFQPFAEWVILHLQLLTGGDLFANSVQLFFYGGCILTASLIARELGGSSKQQLLVAFCTTMIPMAILQSNTTQNDVVVAFFVAALVYFTIRLYKSFSFVDVALAGLSLGLAFLSKGTAYLFTGLFAFWYATLIAKYFLSVDKSRYSKTALLVCIPLIAILINSGFYYRNIALSGSPLGTASETLVNNGYAPNYLALTGLKNYLNHMPVTPGVKQTLTSALASIGMDVNNPAYSHSSIDWMKEGLSFDEDYAQNFVHALLLVVAAITFFIGKRTPVYKLFALTIFASAILFAIAIKWQPWSNRLETSLFVLLSVFLGFELSTWKKPIQVLCSLALIGNGLGALFLSANHPVLPPSKTIWVKPYNSFLYDNEYFQCQSFLDSMKSRKIGLFVGRNTKDYLFYKLLAHGKDFDRRIEHILIQNESKKYSSDFLPDAILSTGAPTETVMVGEKKYFNSRTFVTAEFTLYMPTNIKFYSETERYQVRLRDILALKAAIEKYYSQNKAYPKSSGGWDGVSSIFGLSKKDWIPGITPFYIESLPSDPRNTRDPRKQYLYNSDGKDFKLISNNPENMDRIAKEHPELVDPKRNTWAFGVWSDNAKDW